MSINSFQELHAAVDRLPWWKQIAWAFGLISIPEIDEADERLSAEYYAAMESEGRGNG